jgi:hypothetical protein
LFFNAICRFELGAAQGGKNFVGAHSDLAEGFITGQYIPSDKYREGFLKEVNFRLL